MSGSRSPSHAVCRHVALVLGLLGANAVHATTYMVGTGAGCTHTTLQAAVSAAQASPPGADLIRVTTATYSQQAVTVSATQELDIVGGFASCDVDTPTPNSRAILDGSGGGASPVMRIVVSTGGIVRLRNLTIRRGDPAGAGEGGGIYFEGNGVLFVQDTTIANSVAGYGAGVYARGTGDAALLEFGANVTVSGNTARLSGGGVYVDQVKFYMTTAGSGVFLNEALGEGSGGFGGGLVVLSRVRDSYAFIGTGMGSTGAIFNNKARFGGGVALVGDGPTGTLAQLYVHSPVLGTPARIRNNVASVLGGGLYMQGRENTDIHAFLWNAELSGNKAPDGAAVYSDAESAFTSHRIMFNSDTSFFPPPPGFVCPTGEFCGGVVDNVAQTPDGSATDGAVIHTIRDVKISFGERDDDRMPRGGTVIEGNRGGRLIYSGERSFIELEGVAVVDNQVSFPLIHVGNEGSLKLADATVAGNLIASGNPILQYGDGPLELRRSILWQPDHAVLQCSGCTRTFARIMVNERSSLFGGGDPSEVVVADPRFVDAGNGDYQLRAASPAVDHVAAIAGNDRDALGRARDLDLPIAAGAVGGVRDIGAFERPSLQPLVLNSDLDIDNRTWTVVIPGAVFDDPLNISGGVGSGSLRVYRTGVVRGQPFIAARQCVHLPGPARYALNGWGRTQPNGLFIPPLDSTALLWEVRHNGAEDCTGGTITARGTLNLSSAGWRRPESPALIDIAPADWTARTSVLINLVVVDNSVAPSAADAEGWFDGITLETVSANGATFLDGFE